MIIFMVMAGFIWPVKVSPCVLQHHLNLPSPSLSLPSPALLPYPPRPPVPPPPATAPTGPSPDATEAVGGGVLVRRRGFGGRGDERGEVR